MLAILAMLAINEIIVPTTRRPILKPVLRAWLLTIPHQKCCCEVQLLCSSILVVIVKTQEAGEADAAASCLLPLGGGSTPSGNFPQPPNFLSSCKKALKHYMVCLCPRTLDCLEKARAYTLGNSTFTSEAKGCRNAHAKCLIWLIRSRAEKERG